MSDRILTNADCVRIVAASIRTDRILAGPDGHDGSEPDVLLTAVERILAEHTQALQAEVERLRTGIEALAADADAGEGIVIWPGRREYHLVETGLLRALLGGEAL